MISVKRFLKFSAVFFIITALALVFAACNKDNGNTDHITDKPVLMLHVDNNYSATTISSADGNRITPPTKEGYEFIGYFTADGIKYFEGDGTQVAGILIESSLSLYARFESQSYKLVIDAKDGTFFDGGFAKELSVKLGEPISVTAPIPNGEQYLFDTWMSESGERLEYSNGEITFSADDCGEDGTIKIYAQYKLKEVTLTLNYNDGLTPPKEIKVKWGDNISDLSEHYLAGDGRDVVGFSSLSYMEATYNEIVNSDISLYAVWKMYKTVEFVYPAGQIEAIKVYYSSGESATLPENVRVPGFDLEGWYDNAIYSGAAITKAPSGAILDKYYGKWIVASYEISFDTGFDQSAESMSYYYGDTTALPTLDRVGFTFEGWQIDGSSEPIFNLSADLWGDLSLSAVWTPISYIINLNCLGGTSPATFAEVKYGDSYVLPVPTRDGYTFRGWYNGTERYTDAHGNCIAPWTLADNIDLNALWEISTYTVKYETNGGTSVALQRYKYGETLVFPSDPRKTDGLFRGWYDEALTTEYTPLTAVTSDMTLYAAYVESTPISTPEDFYNIKNNPSGNYHLINDINLRGDNVSPMPEFKGVLNGQGYKIHNFAMNTGADYVGLFASNSGIIRNLVLDELDIVATHSYWYNHSSWEARDHSYNVYCGALVGYNSGRIIGCVTKSVTIKTSYSLTASRVLSHPSASVQNNYERGGFHVGGLVGLSKNGNIYNCETNTNITFSVSSSTAGTASYACTYARVGGLVGTSNGGNIVNCNSYSSVNMSKPGNTSNLVGGIAGYNDAKIFKSYSGATVSCASASSVIIGCISGQNKGNITACVSEGTITGNSSGTLYMGGTVGENAGGNVVDCISNANIIFNSGSSRHIGGIVGVNSAVVKTSCFMGTISTSLAGGNIGGIVGTNNTSGSVMSCVSLGSISVVSGSVHPAIGSSSGISNGNVYDGASVFTLGGNPATPGARNGVEAATIEQLTTESFYHEVLYWETNNWAIENGKLPYLSWYGEIVTDTEEPESGAEA